MSLKTPLMAAVAAIGLSAGLSAPVQAEANPWLGEIQIMSYSFCPRGWAPLNGQMMAIASNSSLFALLGTTYGGDGRISFALPDMRGRSPIGYGQGAILPVNHPLGQAGGAQYGALVEGNLPPHRHFVMASTNDPALNSPSAAAVPTIPNPTREIYTDQPPTTATMQSGTIGNAGGGGQISLQQPSLGVNYCMAIGGNAAFPSRN